VRAMVRSWLSRLRTAAGDGALWLRPEWGFGDHLMLSAVIEGVKAEHPALHVYVAADHPEIFAHNPHVDSVESVARLRRRAPARLARYREVTRRPPAARYMQTSGHLLDDMYASVGVPVRERPRRPRIYLTPSERRFRAAEVDRLRRPRIVVAPHGPPGVRLPNKVYPLARWNVLAPLLGGIAGTLLQVGSTAEGPLLPGAVDYRDLGYRQTASVLGRCDLLVTHVGGIMHLAAAVDLAAVVLYGAAEHPAISGYDWNRNLYVPIECGPCWMEEPCWHHSCMQRLDPQRVLEEVRHALAGAPPGTVEVLDGDGASIAARDR